jgi:hypothetical protein
MLPKGLTLELCRKGGKAGGKLSGEARRRKAMIAAAERAWLLLPEDVTDALTHEQTLRLKVAIGRVWIKARMVGYQTGYWLARGGKPRKVA